MGPRSASSVLAFAVVALGLGLACNSKSTGGTNLVRFPPSIAKTSAPSGSSSAPSLHEADPKGLAWDAIGCFVGGPWSEALGAIGEERTLWDVRRCRHVEEGALGAKDDATLKKLREIDAATVNAAIDALGKQGTSPPMRELIAATAAAARESLDARALASSLRASKKDPTDEEAKTLAKKDALVALGELPSAEAKLVSLILAADRLECGRGLPDRARVIASSPGFEIAFGAAPKGDDWKSVLRSAAQSTGHAPKIDDEPHAWIEIARAFADRFAALAPVMQGPPHDVAVGYADRLRDEIDERREIQLAKSAASASVIPSASGSSAPSTK